jgi:6-phosphogluconolactonase
LDGAFSKRNAPYMGLPGRARLLGAQLPKTTRRLIQTICKRSLSVALRKVLFGLAQVCRGDHDRPEGPAKLFLEEPIVSWITRLGSFSRVSVTLLTLLVSILSAAGGRGGSVESKSNTEFLVYIGTYTGTGTTSRGIYAFRLELAKGTLTPVGLVGETESPSFLAIHPNRRFLYAVNESFAEEKSGGASAFAMDLQSGKLTFLNKQATGGSGACHLVVDRSGKNLLVANYGGGSVAVLPIQKDGRLRESSAFIQHQGSSVEPRRQKGPHAHSINLDSANRFAAVADLGLDKVLVYRFDPTKGSLTPNDPPSTSVKPGGGPRHFAFHPKGRHAYVINEMQSTVTAFAYDARKGTLKELQSLSTVPEKFEGKNSTAEVQVHPSGRFLYGSNRGHNSIAVFAINPETGQLRFIEHQPTQGKTPRNFGIDPTGSYLLAANQESDNIVVFRIDPESGKLTPTGQVVEAPKPVCVKFVPMS